MARPAARRKQQHVHPHRFRALRIAVRQRLGSGNYPPQPVRIDRGIAFFRVLKERLAQAAGTLSGGEQQMLAIGRALMTNPRLLVLDEATEGLAPLVRADIWRALGELKRERLAMLVIDKDLRALLPLADHHSGIEKGRVVLRGTSDEIAAERDRLHALIGV